MDFLSYISRIFTTNEQKHFTAYRELIGLVNSLSIIELSNIGSDHFNKALNNHKLNCSCLTKKSYSRLFYTAERQLTNFQKLRIIYTKRKKLSVADMFNRSFTQKEIQQNQPTHK